MPDFVQTMKDWRRMCQHMEKMGGDRSCDICPLGGCNAIYEDDGNTDYAEIKKKVATWAAENPEPVYPTWVEYLVSIGVIPHEIRLETADALMDTHLLKPIPAYIAQKLGLEPKEGA